MKLKNKFLKFRKIRKWEKRSIKKSK